MDVLATSPSLYAHIPSHETYGAYLHNENFSGIQFYDQRFGFSYETYIKYLQNIIEEMNNEKNKSEQNKNTKVNGPITAKSVHVLAMESIIKNRKMKNA